MRIRKKRRMLRAREFFYGGGMFYTDLTRSTVLVPSEGN